MKPDEAILPNVFQNRSSSTREAAPPEEPEPFLEEPEPSQTALGDRQGSCPNKSRFNAAEQ